MLQSQGKDVTKFLSIHLKYIAADAEKCKHEAKLVLDSFQKVSAILNDLTEAIIILKSYKSKGKTTSNKALDIETHGLKIRGGGVIH